MTERRRIFLNIIATYGRSLYGLLLGLLCGRWTLMALGETDYGLYSLVGGLMVFVTFFNNVLAGANARFYAYSVGAANVAEDKVLALEECRRWFNTALSIHLVVPIVLITLGYPIGSVAIRHWLTIPPERIDACLWVFRYLCVTCFVGMVNVPFMAMYTAKQYIAELTIYSFITSTLNIFVLHYMVNHVGDWLTFYASWCCLLGVIPQLIICVRAYVIFPECQIRQEYLWDMARVRKIGWFTSWQMLGVISGIFKTQGLTILINKLFGPRMNTAYGIGNTVQSQCNTLAGAMQSAFVPVITQAFGAKDYNKMSAYVYRTSKFNLLLTALFSIPLALELPEVMRIWLKTPPTHSVVFCYYAMILHMISSSTTGHMVAINASGRIAAYHVVLCSFGLFTLPLAILAGVVRGGGVHAIMIVLVFMEVLNSLGRLYFARREVSVSITPWIKMVLLPVGFVIGLTLLLGMLPQMFFAQGILRIVVTTLFVESFFIPFSWHFCLLFEEREFVVQRVRLKVGNFMGRLRKGILSV